MNDIKYLNQALQGEQMAILGFDHYIKDIKDSIIKERLQDIQKKHKRQAMRIADKIQELDGNPKNSVGITGAIQEIKYRILPKSHDHKDIIENAIEGEILGIRALEKVEQDLSQENKDMIKQIRMDCMRIVDELYDLKQ